MHDITDADRAAAAELRIILADVCGFWHQAGDNSVLCSAFARHRLEAEQRLADRVFPEPLVGSDEKVRADHQVADTPVRKAILPVTTLAKPALP